MCFKMGVHLLPLGVFLIFPLVFVSSYSIAVRQGHIHPFFAYISDTGTYSPEMCVFALGLSLAMVLIGGTAYVRYMQVAEFIRRTSKGGNSMTNILNKVGLFFGLMAGLGTTIVGSFQELNVISMHVVGAFMAFGGGSIFLVIQGVITKRMSPEFGSAKLAYFRVFLGVACMVLFATCLGAGFKSFGYFTGEDSLRWEAHHGGWGWRVLSTVSEWTMAGLFDLYFLTFVPEFLKISFIPPQFKVHFDSRIEFKLTEVSTVKGKGPNGQPMNVMHELMNSNAD